MSVSTGEITGAERVNNAILQVIEEVSLTGVADLPECIYGQDSPLLITEVIAVSGLLTASPKERREAQRLVCSELGIVANELGIDYPN